MSASDDLEMSTTQAVRSMLLLMPRLVHLTENMADSVRTPAGSISADELNRRINSMIPAPSLPTEPPKLQ